MEISEDKLKAAIGVHSLRPATAEEISAVKAQPGYASPIGIQRSKEKPCIVIIDDLIPLSPNLVAGANEIGYHYMNVNYGRDYQADLVVDIALAQPGYPCPKCHQALKMETGIPIVREILHEDKISTPLNAIFQDEQGKKHPLYGSHLYLNLSSLFGCLSDQHHDQYGLIIPKSISPYQIYLIVLADKDSSQSVETAETIYHELRKRNYEVLFDDRDERPGVKFNDADLLGIPLRLTVSQRAISEGGIEWKERDKNEKVLVPLNELYYKIDAFFEH